MKDNVPGFSVLSDISANMFAAFVLVLLLAAAFADSAAPKPGASAPGADSIEKLELTSRTASAPSVMVQILFDRRPWAPGVSIDLMRSRLTVTAPPHASVSANVDRDSAATTLAAILDGFPPSRARLYVFSNELYYPVASMLARLGGFQEISVPAALRSADGSEWSKDFVRLSRSTTDANEFTDGLARLLEGGRSAVLETDVGGGPAGLGEAAATSERSWRFLRALALAIIASAAIGSIVWIELETR
jgi:hypothetical protein